MIIYNNVTGLPVYKIPDKIDPDVFLEPKSDDFKKNHSFIRNENGSMWSKYRVIDGKFIKMTNDELLEIMRYGKILNQEEHILLELYPSTEEIKKAETTIEILSLLSEVL